MAVGVFTAAGCGSAPDPETARKFQEAEELFAAAQSPMDFVQAANLYQEILDAGFESGVVLYNQGNAWMQAGHKGRAIASYRQAKRHLPRDPYLDANLKQALSIGSAAPKTPLADYIFFWQQSVSYMEKAVIVTVLLLITVLCALAAQLKSDIRALRRITYVCLIATLVMGASLARDWLNYDCTQHAVVLTETIARKGGAESYEPAFTQPLNEGREGVVLSRTNDWVQIQFGESAAGWLPARNCTLY